MCLPSTMSCGMQYVPQEDSFALAAVVAYSFMPLALASELSHWNIEPDCQICAADGYVIWHGSVARMRGKHGKYGKQGKYGKYPYGRCRMVYLWQVRQVSLWQVQVSLFASQASK
jgi:hypothetical protein